MRTNLVIAGSLVTGVGLVLLGVAFFPTVSGEQWNLATSEVLQNKNSFTVYLVSGYYRMSAAGGEAAFPYTGNPPTLQIMDSVLTEIDARALEEGQYQYFWINSSDTYSFYFLSWSPMANNPITVGMDLRTYQISYPNNPIAPIGVAVLFAGLGSTVYGLIAKRNGHQNNGLH